MSEVWLPFCIRDPAPLEKTGYFGIGRTRDILTIDGEVKHSMEGSFSVARGMMFDSSLQKSWTFSVPKAGPPYQHYPIEYITWTSGGPVPNVRFVATETEGRVGEPLTENQVHWSTEITRALRELCPSIAANPPARRVNLWEHNEMTQFGAAFTTCPSGRIPWDEIILRLTVVAPPPVEEDLTENQSNQLTDVYLKSYENATALAKLLAKLDTLIETLAKGAHSHDA